SVNAKRVEESSTGASMGVSRLGAELGVAAEAGRLLGDVILKTVEAGVDLARNQIELADQVGTTAARIGASTEELSALGAAARRNNADFADVVSELDSVSNAAVRAAAQGGRGSREFSAAF